MILRSAKMRRVVLSIAVVGLASTSALATPYDDAVNALSPVVYYQYGTAGDGSQSTNDSGSAGTQIITAGSTSTGNRGNTVAGTFGFTPSPNYTPATGFYGFASDNVVSTYPGTTIANNLSITSGTSGTNAQAASIKSALSGASGLTVSTWVSTTIPTTTINPTPIEIVLGAANSATSTVSCFQLIFTQTGIRVGGRASNSDSTFKSFDITYAAAGIDASNVGNLNNYVGVLDYTDNNIKIYVNGRLAGTSTGAAFTGTAPLTLTFGANSPTGGIVGLGGVYTTFTNSGTAAASGTIAGTASNQNFTGIQDATSIFNTELTATQISNLYTTAPEPTSLGLLGLGALGLMRRRSRKA